MPARMYGYNPHNGKSRPAYLFVFGDVNKQTGIRAAWKPGVFVDYPLID